MLALYIGHPSLTLMHIYSGDYHSVGRRYIGMAHAAPPMHSKPSNSEVLCTWLYSRATTLTVSKFKIAEQSRKHSIRESARLV